METYTSILITQIPIAMGCLWMAYEMYRIRISFENIEKKLRGRKN
ncbi:MAG: hypothetical protein QXW00_02525 [Candidatus Woesearchaeota archaeon]